MQTADWTNHYAFLPATTDLTNPENTGLSRSMDNVLADIGAQLSFFDLELKAVDTAILDQVEKEEPQFSLEKISELTLEEYQDFFTAKIAEYFNNLEPYWIFSADTKR